MIITPNVLNNLMTGFSASFQGGLNSTPTAWQQVAMHVTSNTASNTYGWLGQFPAMREWVGDRLLRDMQAHSYSIVNKKFESTVDVLRTDIEDDVLGIYKPLFEELGRAAAAHPDEMVFGCLAKGDVLTCYDGQPFFDADHPVFADVAGKSTATTVSNVYKGDSPAWYLLDTSRAIKPIIYQERKKMQLTAMTRDDDESVFMRDTYRYGVDGRNNVGFGFWQTAAMSKEALTAASFEKAYTAMRSLKADGGRPLGIRPTVIVVPPTLLSQAYAIVKAEKVGNNSNPNFGKVEIIETEWLL